MAVPVTAIHAFVTEGEGADARDKREHGVEGDGGSPPTPKPDGQAYAGRRSKIPVLCALDSMEW
jgi:hypothetical protein